MPSAASISGLVVLALVVARIAPAQAGADRIQLGILVAEQGSDKLPASAVGILRNRLESALAREGAGRSLGEVPTRFVARLAVTLLEQNVTSTAPPMFVYSTEVAVVFGDVVTGVTVAEFRAPAKGVGRSEEGAYREVARQVRFEGDRWRATVQGARSGIVSYFERSCDGILRDGRTLVTRAEFERALFILGSVPQEAAKCHERASDLMATVYTAYLRDQCEKDMGKAEAMWAADQTRDGAVRAADILGEVNLSSPCAPSVRALLAEVTNRLAQYDAAAAAERRSRAEFARKKYDDELDMRRKRFALAEKQSDQGHAERKLIVGAARDVGVAWARAAENRKPEEIRQTFIVR